MTIWDDRYKTGKGLRWWPNEELIRFLGKTYGKTYGFRGDPARIAFDLGCGTGCNTWALYEAGFDVHAIDRSADAIKAANDYLSDRVRTDGIVLQCADVLTCLAAPGANHYDLVVDCQTIQHLSREDHVTAYTEIRRILKPGGRFWTMHFAAGDADVVYADSYPELQRCSVESQRERLLSHAFYVEEWAVVSRTYNRCAQIIRWAVIEAVKP
jgi:SAM-dependent methyltransferase